MKLIHVTDTHLIHPGKTLHGLDPEFRFEACMKDIILNHSDADCLLITGDLADKGEASAYELMAKSLKQYPVPATWCLGIMMTGRCSQNIFLVLNLMKTDSFNTKSRLRKAFF